mmetsp:Transcript_12160/g.40377  ORF Transcript_12160/g.40377 Transcript_12160/m.40377 type:complete len:267 (+) Transcript_12160:568-1368(+)
MYVTARFRALSLVASRLSRKTWVTATRTDARYASFDSVSQFFRAVSATETLTTSCGKGNPLSSFSARWDFVASCSLRARTRSTRTTLGSRPASMRCTARALALAATSSFSLELFIKLFAPSFFSFSRVSASISPAFRRSSSASAAVSAARNSARRLAFSARSTLPFTPSSSRRNRASWCVRCSSTCSRSFSVVSSIAAISRSRETMELSVSSIARKIVSFCFSENTSISRLAATLALLTATSAARATGSEGPRDLGLGSGARWWSR